MEENNLTQVRTLPTSGQFVAIWTFNGLPWSRVFTWKNNKLCVKNSELTNQTYNQMLKNAYFFI